MVPNYDIWAQVQAIFWLLDFLAILPVANLFLGKAYSGERWAYGWRLWSVAALWPLACGMIFFDFYRIFGGFLLWGIFRVFYIRQRFTSLTRGGGAPGLISYMMATYLTGIELLRILDPSGGLMNDAKNLFQTDFGLIFVCSGLYKILSGYANGEGIEFALANPFWSYSFRWFRKLKPKTTFLNLQNYFASFGQLLGGLGILLGLLFPAMAYLGSALIFLIFGTVVFMVRVGRLGPQICANVLFFLPDMNTSIWPTSHVGLSKWTVSPGLILSLHWLLVGAIPLLFILKISQWLNFYLDREIPWPFHKFFVSLAAAIPIGIWRVFTADITNFYFRISATNKNTGDKRILLHEDDIYSYRGLGRIKYAMRYLSVIESAGLASMFNCLRYFHSDESVFRNKLLRYTHTLELKPDEIAEYEVRLIVPRSNQFEYLPVVCFSVDLSTNSIIERKLSTEFEFRDRTKYSRIRESKGFGTYERKRDEAGSGAAALASPIVTSRDYQK
jgi:hypothetical protein